MASLESLRDIWTELYSTKLPQLAKTRDPVQARWPIDRDHCFARVILDNAVGLNKPWTEILKAPAYKNMSEAQLKAAIDLGERIVQGRENLVQLDKRSLQLRGKVKGRGSVLVKAHSMKRKSGDSTGTDQNGQEEDQRPKKSRKGEMADLWARFSASAATKQPPVVHKALYLSNAEPTKQPNISKPSEGTLPIQDNEKALAAIRTVIAEDKTITPFQKLTLTLLTQIPRGRYSTYQHLANHISKTSHKTCARAIGNAMRTNPYAPTAPCHRVLATGGKLGGFKGDWGDDGRFSKEKRRLLKEEGVWFDGKGVAVGTPFKEFV